jgi:hypothetical protein
VRIALGLPDPADLADPQGELPLTGTDADS